MPTHYQICARTSALLPRSTPPAAHISQQRKKILRKDGNGPSAKRRCPCPRLTVVSKSLVFGHNSQWSIYHQYSYNRTLYKFLKCSIVASLNRPSSHFSRFVLSPSPFSTPRGPQFSVCSLFSFSGVVAHTNSRYDRRWPRIVKV